MADVIAENVILWILLICCVGTRIVRAALNIRSKGSEGEKTALEE